MSARLYFSNSLEDLAIKFSEFNKSINSIFESELIITQTPGVDRYLSLETAKRNRIFTNFRFSNISPFIQEICELANLRTDNSFYSGNLKWIIYSELDNENFIDTFPIVSSYYNNEDLKRFQLADKCADLFNKYMIYRSDFISSWNNNEHAIINNGNNDFKDAEQWQFYLWQRIKEKCNKYSLDSFQLKKELINKLNNTEFQTIIKKKYSRISFFGLKVITDFHLDIIKELSKTIDINIYSLCSYTSNILENNKINTLNNSSLNPLIYKFTHIENNLFAQLLIEDTFIESVHNCSQLEPNTDTLLKIIQNDIYANNNSLNKIDNSFFDDGSLQINSTYTPVREIESLYNYLLEQFNNDKSLLPKDIIVHVSNIDKYAAYIRAIFDNAPVYIPYSINDRTYNNSDTLVSALTDIINLNEDNFTSERIVSLLEYSFIRKLFGITNIDFIRELLSQSNIHFGINGDKDDDTLFVSWTYGLDRMILGYCINGGEEYNLGKYTCFPIDMFEGEMAHEMLRFKAFVDCLINLIEKRDGYRTLSYWKEYVLKEIVEKLFYVEDESKDDYKYILNSLLYTNEKKKLSEEKISYTIFLTSITNSLKEDVRVGSLINGKLCFCSMQTLQTVPFKIKALIGLDSGSFPRRSSKLGFDLIKMEERDGDNNIKNNDRQAFIDCITSCRNNLYISYIGHNTNDNSDLQPSLFIDELIDYIESYSNDKSAKKYLVTNHPLYSFSKRYFEGKKRLFTYIDDKESNENFIGKRKDITPKDYKIINIENLISFCKDPFKWYYNKSLGIYYNSESVLLSETELFTLNKLEKYKVKMSLVECVDTAAFINKAKKTGILPLANMAEVCCDDLNETITSIKETVNNLKNGKEREIINIDFSIGETNMIGFVDNIYNDKHIEYNVSGSYSEAKYIIEAWIKHLSLILSNNAMDTFIVSPCYEFGLLLPKDILNIEQASILMRAIFEAYKKGSEEIIPFTPNVGFHFIKSNTDNSEPLSLADKLQIIEAIKKEGMISYGKDFFNDYIEKEIEQGLFNRETNNMEDFKSLSVSLFESIVKKVFN